jgi:hypothetical protein
MESWQMLAAALLGDATVLAVMGWLGKSLLEKLLQRDFKRFEIEIKAKADRAIEQLKSELQLRTIEHQVAFSGLHQKRASVIEELNALLAETLWEAQSVLSPIRWAGGPDERELHKAAEAKLVEFFRYFDKHRIYLPVDLSNAVEELVRAVRHHVIGFGVYLAWDDYALQDHTRKEKSDALLAGYTLLKDQVPQLRAKLENEFRSLLGPSGKAV